MAGLGMFITEVHLYRDSSYLEGEYKLSMAWYAERKKKMLVLYLWCRNEVRSKCGVSMNLQQARRTLGITPEDDKAAIKKKYRHLMGQFHPDAQVGRMP